MKTMAKITTQQRDLFKYLKTKRNLRKAERNVNLCEKSEKTKHFSFLKLLLRSVTF